MKTDYAAKRYVAEQKKAILKDREIKELKKELSIAQDFNAALTSENLELGKINRDYQERYNKECYNVVVNGEYVTELIKLPAYRSYLPLQEIEGYDMNKVTQFMQMPLYAKIPFVYVDNRQLKVDAKQYKKFIGGII